MNELTSLATKIVDTAIGWGNSIFSNFNFFSSNYSKLVIYGIILWIATKILRVKIDVKTGK